MQAKSENTHAVFVRQLNESSSKDSLIKYFSRFGAVLCVKLSLKKREMK